MAIDAEAPPELSATGQVILGMIALGKQTGYDIKQLVDKSTRHFWAASYGQIYPELRKLEEKGLVRGSSEPSGGRARTVYELTAEGHRALEQSLAPSEEPLFELRDEGMLKLFFSDLAPDRQLEIVVAIRRRQERKLEQLRAVGAAMDDAPSGPRLTLAAGMAMTQAFLDWAKATEDRLAADSKE
ncbi:MAG: PadR family transcriptional regulator [Solirubrobacterales bacterium]|nr:PadR family transcriptional regulator [Solirubrobacterales bacterium]